MQTILPVLNQMAFLFLLIIIGFVLVKLKVLSSSASAVLAKLENNVFIPALVLSTFMQQCTVEKLSASWKVVLVSAIILVVIIPLAIILSKLCVKNKYIQKIYTYGLCFSNFGFMGNAIVSALFPQIFFEYLIFTLPLWATIYIWGVPSLLMSNDDYSNTNESREENQKSKENKGKNSLKSRLKSFLNPMFIAMIIGAIIGVSGLKMPLFIDTLVSSCGNCMSPVAMLLTGITLSNTNLKKIFANWNIYIVSIIRLVIFPLIFIGLFQIIPMEKTIVTCAICSLAMPLGLNTIVIPSAYGKDTTIAAGMAVISHLLSIITIPLIFTLI